MNGRLAADLEGLLLIDKPQNLTSHDLVFRLRRMTGQKKIGHTGTLDPLATGLMAVLLGAATRLSPYLVKMGKFYQGRMVLGLVTDTDDARGRILSRHLGPWPRENEIRRALKDREGESDQIPPAFSAIRVKGRRAYHAARAGAPLELAPRKVTAFHLGLTRYEPPVLDFTANVSSGYYIRALARDLGRALGLGGGALTELRRIGIGPWTLDQARTLEGLAGWTEEEWLAGLKPSAEVLAHWPAQVLADALLIRNFTQGQKVPADGQAGCYRILDDQGRLLGLGQLETGGALEGDAPPQGPFMRPLRVFPVSWETADAPITGRSKHVHHH